MQQPETARIRGTYCLYPALVRAPISGVCLRSRYTFYLHRSNVSDFAGLEFNCGRGIIELWGFSEMIHRGGKRAATPLGGSF